MLDICFCVSYIIQFYIVTSTLVVTELVLSFICMISSFTRVCEVFLRKSFFSITYPLWIIGSLVCHHQKGEIVSLQGRSPR